MAGPAGSRPGPRNARRGAAGPWVVAGCAGLLGSALVRRLRRAGTPVVGLDRTRLDVTDAAAVDRAIRELRPAVLVNCAAWTAVDAAERHEAAAARINADGPRNLAYACARGGGLLVHVSTDYVFDGRARTPYREDAPPCPINAYGRTKLAGERAVLAALPETGYVVRTAWLYGRDGRGDFVRTMRRRARADEAVDVVDDQIGQPTWARELAGRIAALGDRALAGRAPPGIYHGTGAGQATWYELAREVFGLVGGDPGLVRPIGSDRLPLPTPRPPYTVLGHARWSAAGMAAPRHWRDALAEALRDDL